MAATAPMTALTIPVVEAVAEAAVMVVVAVGQEWPVLLLELQCVFCQSY